jgi:hypothetical protein
VIPEQIFINDKFGDCDLFWSFESEVTLEEQRKDI